MVWDPLVIKAKKLNNYQGRFITTIHPDEYSSFFYSGHHLFILFITFAAYS